MESDSAARHGLAVSVYFCCHVYSGTTDSVRVFQMETTSAARLGLAVVYSGTPNFVRAFQMEAASAACLGIAVSVYFRCHVYSGTTDFVMVFQMEPDTAARLGFSCCLQRHP